MNDFSAAIANPDISLGGFALVEAGAGTGKTYNIQSAYLRLVIAEGLRVQNILVVTFTEAATTELRARLRGILAAAAHDPDSPRTRPFMSLPLGGERSPFFENDAAAERSLRIRRALRDFDGAPVSTIHGFCKRVLERHAFECGSDPEAKILADPSELLATLCRDWWRRNTYEVEADTRDAEKVPFDNFSELHATVHEAMRNRHALRPMLSREERRKTATLFVQTVDRALKSMPTATPQNEEARIVERKLREFREFQDAAPSPLPFSTLFTFLAPIAIAVAKESIEEDDESEKKGGAPTWRDPRTNELIRLWERLAGTQSIAATAASVIPSRKNEIVTEILGTLAGVLRESRTITYDSMLEQVRDALRARETGPILRRVLREEYHAALVDEFQDTDPIQAEIFNNIFNENERTAAPLLCVGDPKQAIYAFRGGDIFTYYEAAQGTPPERHFHLNTNYRSAPALVAAINAFFEETTPPSAPPAFANTNIHFQPSASVPQAPERQLTFPAPDGTSAPDPAPFKFWIGLTSNPRPPAARGPEANAVRDATANEITRLLAAAGTANGIQYGGRPLMGGDIAILTNTNTEAAEYQKALLARGVLSARHNSNNVFDSPAARRIAILMRALLTPSSVAALNSLNHCGLFPPLPQENLSQILHETSKTWHRHGFLNAFEAIAGATKLREHTATRKGHDPNAHIALLHQILALINAASVENREPGALHRWLARQLDTQTRDDESAFQVRAIPADNAVRIMTIHKSKGLEFPIVFVPTLWRRKATLNKNARYAAWHASVHDNEWDGEKAEIHLDLLKNNPMANKDAAIHEAFEENIRLAYVALTRATARLYLPVFLPVVADTAGRLGRGKEKAGIPMAMTEEVFPGKNWFQWLRDANPCARTIDEVDFETPPAKKLLSPKLPKTCETNALLHLAARIARPLARGIEASAIIPAKDPPPHLPPPIRSTTALMAHGVAKVNKHAGGTSFSALSERVESPSPPPPENDADMDARDTHDGSAPPEPDPLPDIDLPAQATPDIFLFPGGAATGECWHQIFQEMDFQAPKSEIFALADAILEKHGLCDTTRPNSKRTAVHQMLLHALRTPLPEIPQKHGMPGIGTQPFSLDQIPKASRVHELAFDLSLNSNQATLAEVADRIERHWNIDPAFTRKLRASRASFPEGWLTGAIDLLFQHAGRFYIVDWKSNRIRAHPDDFSPQGLAREMVRHDYPLQSLLYTFATHIWLRQTLLRYDYDAHFGGAYYIFLRGLDGTPDRGIHASRPPLALLESLERLLLPGTAQRPTLAPLHAKRLPKNSWNQMELE
ncbi:MAG: UvrD-helicase domain-containing protein [Puniceicoccales bacterium]|jgi:exodeoxyribonuclease V beta subunit|nr:UvrD-helicase domain-containing protein [Puniceicoccales bacterium]